MAERLTIDKAATYRIKIQGSLSMSWAEYLGGLDIEVYQEGLWPVTALHGSVRDQAELLGILNSLYDFGYPLLSVECQDPFQKKTLE